MRHNSLSPQSFLSGAWSKGDQGRKKIYPPTDSQITVAHSKALPVSRTVVVLVSGDCGDFGHITVSGNCQTVEI